MHWCPECGQPCECDGEEARYFPRVEPCGCPCVDEMMAFYDSGEYFWDDWFEIVCLERALSPDDS